MQDFTIKWLENEQLKLLKKINNLHEKYGWEENPKKAEKLDNKITELKQLKDNLYLLEKVYSQYKTGNYTDNLVRKGERIY